MKLIKIKYLISILWLVNYVNCSAGGESTTFRKQDDHGNYAFGYDINDGKGGNNFHKETGDEYGNKRGSYGILGSDGKMRIVHYIADEHGFRVDIKSNEPGLASGKDSANVVVNRQDYGSIDHSTDHNLIGDYSSTFDQRTPEYTHPAPSGLLYSSSTSNLPSSSKSYYPESISYIKPTYSKAIIPVKPKYNLYDYPAKPYSKYPKNVAYISPKYNFYPAKSYYASNQYESSATPVHQTSYSPVQYRSIYDQNDGSYGLRKPSYTSDYYAKLAKPVYSYTKLSGYETEKHDENTKYYDEPQSSITSNTIFKATGNPQYSDESNNKLSSKQDELDLAASYRTQTSPLILNKRIVLAKQPQSNLVNTSDLYLAPSNKETEHKSS